MGKKWLKKVTSESLKKTYMYRIIVILCISFLLGCLFEIFYELNVHRKVLKNSHLAQEEVIPDEMIEISEIQFQNSDEQTEVLKSYHITIKERYINKLRYTYKSTVNFAPDVKIHTKNVYKNLEIRNVKDLCRFNLNESIINVKDYVTKVEIQVPQDVVIGDFVIDNSWDFNWYRVFYVAVFIFLIVFIITFKKIIARKIEYGFVVVSLFCGCLFISLQPPECGSWDEHIHFSKVFDWFEHGTADRSMSEYYIYNNPETFERAAFLSKEEKKLQIQYLNQNSDEVVEIYERNAHTLTAVGEFHMAVIVKIVKHLGLPFYMQFVFAKLANLLLYTFIMFYAIRLTPIGKKFLTVISLMPTLMLQSVSFTYDVVLVSFIALGFSMIINEFFEVHKKLTWKRMLLIACAFVLGSCPKPIYIVLLALMLALPEEKFSSKKVMFFYKTIIIVICVGMLMMLLLPAANGEVQGDTRGGDTNVTAQLQVVFSHPIGYIKVFFKDFISTWDNYFFGSDSLGFLAYANSHPFDSFIGVFCVGIALSEKKKKFVLKKKDMVCYKVLLAILIFAVIGLTWSALYIVFTPVGQTHIAGVQARYYVPLLYPLFMLFYTEKIEGKWKDESYTMTIMLIVLWITHEAIYKQYFIPFCQ